MINMSATNLYHFHPISKRDDADYEDSQDTKPETSTRNHGKSKVFQCTGYGDCKMVFTRSEHLARHMRKHTGEKPFKCVVPGCDRMFSRFDNMMQHTQTHNKSRGGPRRNSKSRTRRGSKKLSSRRSSDSLDYEEYVLPSPPPSRRGSSHNIIKEHQIILPNPKYVELDQDEDDKDEDYEEEDSMFMDYQKPYYYYSQQKHMPPDSPTSSDSSMHLHDFFPTPSRRRSAPQVRYQPYPYHQSHLKEQQEIIPSIPRRNSVLSQLATYLVDHPDKSPENFLKHHQKQDVPTRRLSIQDLANPIEQLAVSSSNNSISNMSASTSTSSISSHHTEDEELEGIDLTEDEFQAIQGFGKFYRTAINL